MTYLIVTCADIGTDCAEETIPPFVVYGPLQVTAGCCDSRVLVWREYVTILSEEYKVCNSSLCRF
jgi:hypothetical protein